MNLKTKKKLDWAARIIVALIFLQTLFFKFTASPESVYIFEKIGLEPLGRIFSGIVELITAILILVPSTVIVGAILSLLVIVPAIVFHLTSLGIVVQNDGGLLFGMAVAILLLSIYILFNHLKNK